MPTQKQIDAARKVLEQAGVTATPTVRVYADISADANAKLEKSAQAAGITKKAMLEKLIGGIK